MRRFLLQYGLLATLTMALDGPALLADQFHYNNVLVGTRAVGLGGAFGGVADDASGLYYNPGGLAFALADDIQGSATAFYSKNTVYKQAVGSNDFTEKSAGSLTPFFGFLQKLDRHVEKLVFAFGVYYTDGDLKDQDTVLDNVQSGSSLIEHYHRTSNARAGTYFAGAALGYRILPNLGIGLALSYYDSEELVQEFQFSKQHVQIPLTNGTKIAGYQILSSNVLQHLAVYGLQPTLGIQAALPAGLTAGLSLKKVVPVSQKFSLTSDVNKTYATDAQNNAAVSSVGVTRIASPLQNEIDQASITSTKPVGDMPLEARLSFAWFASATFLWTFDAVYHDAVGNADYATDPIQVRPAYARQAVTDYSTGIEWYIAPSFPIRAGVFTNFDARPKIKEASSDAKAAHSCNYATDSDYYKNYCAQPDHIDYYGGSLFIAWVQPTSQIAAGVTAQSGSGQAQKLGDDHVQKVKSQQFSFAFSATHNL